jgi:hypothetical protein
MSADAFDEWLNMLGKRICLLIGCSLGGSLLASPTASQESVPVETTVGPHICWVDKVLIERDGVRVIFSPTGYNVSGGTKQGRFVVGHGQIYWLSGPNERMSESGLLLLKSERAFLAQGVEDACEISFAEMSARVGIIAHASLTLPYLPHDEKKVFIPAQ